MINDSKQCVGVMGLGYVGLPLVMSLVEAGFDVVGFDTDHKKVNALRDGKCYLKHVDQKRIGAVCRSSSFKATWAPENLIECDTVLVCVPTPLSEGREPDLSYVKQAIEQVSIYAERCKLVVLESTTWPGTTREVVAPYFGSDVLIAYSPEREDPGNAHYWLATTPKLVGGLTVEATRVACELYGHICKTVVPVDSPEIAEASKCFENTFRMVNISLVNEFKILCQRLGIDPFKVIAAAETKPFGFKAFWPGPGVGGHCLPLDAFYLVWKARQVGTPLKFVEAAWEVNKEMPRRVGRVVADALNAESKPLQDSLVLVIGAAYKKNIGDTRESPARDVVRWLLNRNANVFLHDPHCPDAADEFGCHQCHTLNSQSIGIADVVVILTDHDTIIWSDVYVHARLIVDTRNVFAGDPNVVQA
jgi:UDP-N-acetyl-D-glucosamine dehydrogenase